mgnify:CR=1 FL=1
MNISIILTSISKFNGCRILIRFLLTVGSGSGVLRSGHNPWDLFLGSSVFYEFYLLFNVHVFSVLKVPIIDVRPIHCMWDKYRVITYKCYN